MADPADDEPGLVSAAPADDEDTGSLVARVKDLADDTRTAIEAELAWQSARAGYLGSHAGGVAGWSALALLCVFIALLSLAFGAILALAPLIGAVLATLVVVVFLLAIAGIAALVARGRILRIKATAFPAKTSSAP